MGKKYQDTHVVHQAKSKKYLANPKTIKKAESETDEEELFDDEDLQVHIWEKLPHESGAAYSYFCVFRDMGAERNLVKAAVLLKKSPKTLRHYSADYKWTKRSHAYDAHIAEIRTSLKIKAIKEMEDRHISHTQGLSKCLMIAVQEVTNRVRDNNLGDLKEISFTKLYDIVQKSATIFPNIVKTERLAMGVSTEITQQDITSGNKSLNSDFDDFKDKLLGVIENSPAEIKKKVLETLDLMAGDD